MKMVHLVPWDRGEEDRLFGRGGVGGLRREPQFGHGRVVGVGAIVDY
jgi:hypothetical protein